MALNKKGKKMKKKGKEKSKIRSSSDKELLDYLKDGTVSQLQDGNFNQKVGGLLKIIELQKKLSSDSGAEEKFWEVIEQIRQEGLKDA